MKKVNDCMNNVQQSTAGSDAGGRGAGAGNVQLDHNAIMQMLGYDCAAAYVSLLLWRWY